MTTLPPGRERDCARRRMPLVQRLTGRSRILIIAAADLAVKDFSLPPPPSPPSPPSPPPPHPPWSALSSDHRLGRPPRLLLHLLLLLLLLLLQPLLSPWVHYFCDDPLRGGSGGGGRKPITSPPVGAPSPAHREIDSRHVRASAGRPPTPSRALSGSHP